MNKNRTQLPLQINKFVEESNDFHFKSKRSRIYKLNLTAPIT
ncbi:hypothetical protein QUB80_34220 [Chlorogloeopsis sp. ULAP01]|nr:hypothetical protein [Chlorogloeopsis sp. ULAP01]MDM9385712.1 hypothetical protein [Chlorogloeopsis sp. ULAP01]